MWGAIRARFRRGPAAAGPETDVQQYQRQQAAVRRDLAWLEQQVALLTRDLAPLTPPPLDVTVPPRPPRKAWRL